MSENSQESTHTSNGTNTLIGIIGRLFVAGIVLGITAFFTPGFQINNIWTLIVAAIVLTALDYLVSKITGLEASPFGKGLTGFVLSAVILYVTQFFVSGYSISWVAALIGALIYGVVDYLIPGNQSM